MTLIGYASEYWLDFDGWCLSNGIEPLEMPSRRFFSAVWRWMTEGLDQEQVENLFTQMDQSIYDLEARVKARMTAISEEKESTESKVIPYKPFEAPPGWTPPGWSDEAAYRNSLAGMMGVNSAGGGKIGGNVK